jgi:GLPGLI family protein
MKMKLIYTLFLLTISFYSYCQQTEGYFQYSIKVTAVDTSLKTQQTVGMLFDSKMELFYTKTQSRMNFKMGTIYDNSIVVNKTENKGISLMSSPSGKFAITLGEKEINAKPKIADSLIKVELVNEKKVILGFNCKKAILRQGPSEMIYWYTNEIVVDKTGQTILNEKIPGFPLYFSMIADGMKMEYQASNYKFQVENKEKIFSLEIPTDYKLINTGY